MFKQTLKKIYLFLFGKEEKPTLFSWNYLYKTFNSKIIKEKAYLFKHKVVLDYGCGRAPYFNIVHKYCRLYIGVDFEQPLINNKKFEFFSLYDKGLQDLKADIILSNQVIMEVDSLDEYLENLVAFSKNDTLIIFTSPFLQPLGLNDKARYSPYFISKKMKEKGFDLKDYCTQGYLWGGMMLSLNMLLVMNNKYNLENDSVSINIYKQIIFSPLILLNNVLGIILDKILPLYRMPSNFCIIFQRRKK